MFCLAGVLLFASLFLPWWHLDLVAPQYPEGLSVIVYPDKLDGRIDIINNINHYIGMKWITEDDFPEFQVIPIVAYVIIGLALLTALLKKGGLPGLPPGWPPSEGPLGCTICGVGCVITERNWIPWRRLKLIPLPLRLSVRISLLILSPIPASIQAATYSD